LEINVRTSSIVHGFDPDNKEIIEVVDEHEYVKKLVLIDRIQSVSEKYILVTSSHRRVMYWEYEENLEQLKARLEKTGVLIV
jgi:hypothetical protein